MAPNALEAIINGTQFFELFHFQFSSDEGQPGASKNNPSSSQTRHKCRKIKQRTNRPGSAYSTPGQRLSVQNLSSYYDDSIPQSNYNILRKDPALALLCHRSKSKSWPKLPLPHLIKIIIKDHPNIPPRELVEHFPFHPSSPTHLSILHANYSPHAPSRTKFKLHSPQVSFFSYIRTRKA